MSEGEAHDGGTIALKVVADARGFRKDLQNKLNKATRGLDVKIGIAVNSIGLRERIEEAVQEAAAGVSATVNLHVNRQQAKEALDEAIAEIGDDITVRIKAVGSLIDDVARESAAAEAAAEADPVQVPIEPNGRRWSRAWAKWLAATKSRISRDPKSRIQVPVEPKLDRKALAKALNKPLKLRPLVYASLAALLQPLVALLGSVGAGLTALAAAAGASIGVVGALPGVIGALGAGLIVTTVATNGFVESLGKLVSAGIYANGTTKLTAEQTTVLRDALKGLPKPMQETVKESALLTKQFRGLRASIQRNFFEPIVGGVAQLGTLLLPRLNKGLGETAAALGRVTRAFLDYFSSKKFTDELPATFKVFSNLLERSGFALLGLTKSSVDFTAASRPLLRRVGEWISVLGVWAERTARVGRETGSTAEFLDYAADKTEQLGRITKSSFGGLAGVFRAARAAGDDMLNRIEQGLDRFDEWANSSKGQKAITAFVDDAMPGFYALADLIGAIGAALGRLAVSPQLAGMLDDLRTETLPPLEELFSNLGQFLGPPVIDLISELVELLGHLSGAAKPLGDLVGVLSTVLGWVNDFLTAHDEFATAIGTVGGALFVLSTVLSVLSKFGFGKITKGLQSVAKAGLGLLSGLGGGGGKAGGARDKAAEKEGLKGQQVFWKTPMPVYITNKRSGGKSGSGAGGSKGSGGGGFDDLLEGSDEDKKKGGRKTRSGRHGGFGGGIPIDRDASIDEIFGGAKKKKSRLSKLLAPLRDAAKKAGGRDLGNTVARGAGLAELGLAPLGRSTSGGRIGKEIGETVARSSGLAKAFTKGGALAPVKTFSGAAAGTLGKGGVLGAIAGLAGEAIGNKVKDGRGGARDIGGGALAGAASGAGTGALIGSFIGPVGTGLGAAIGGVLGGVIGALRSGGAEKLKKAFADLGINSVGDFAKAVGKGLIAVVEFISGLPLRIAKAGLKLGQALVGPAKDLMGNVYDALRSKDKQVTGFIRGLPGRVIVAAVKLAGALTGKGRELMANFRVGISDTFPKVITFISRLIPVRIKAAAKFGGILLGAGRDLVGGFAGSIRDRAERVYDRIRNLGRSIKGIAGKFPSLSGAGARLIMSLVSGILSKISAVGDAAGRIAKKIKGYFPGSPIRTGPLKSWNGGGAGKLLGGFLADGLLSSEPDVRAAAGALASAVSEADLAAGSSVPLTNRSAGSAAGFAVAGGGAPTFEAGAFVINNPAVEPASTSIAARLRTISAFGLFE